MYPRVRSNPAGTRFNLLRSSVDVSTSNAITAIDILDESGVPDVGIEATDAGMAGHGEAGHTAEKKEREGSHESNRADRPVPEAGGETIARCAPDFRACECVLPAPGGASAESPGPDDRLGSVRPLGALRHVVVTTGRAELTARCRNRNARRYTSRL
jgi:hypothetical protein